MAQIFLGITTTNRERVVQDFVLFPLHQSYRSKVCISVNYRVISIYINKISLTKPPLTTPQKYWSRSGYFMKNILQSFLLIDLSKVLKIKKAWYCIINIITCYKFCIQNFYYGYKTWYLITRQLKVLCSNASSFLSDSIFHLKTLVNIQFFAFLWDLFSPWCRISVVPSVHLLIHPFLYLLYLIFAPSKQYINSIK